MLSVTRKSFASGAFALTTLAVTSLSGVSFAQEDTAPTLFDRLPQNVMAAFQIKDMTATSEKLEGSRFNDAWQSDDMLSFRDMMEEAMGEMQKEFAEDTDLDLKEIMGYATGDVTVTLVDVLSGNDYGMGDEPLFEVVTVMEIDPDSRDSIQNTIDMILADVPEEAEKAIYDVAGMEVRTVSMTNEYTVEEYEWQTGEVIEVNKVDKTVLEYGFVDDLFFFGTGMEKPSGKVLASLYGEGEPGLSNHPGINKLNQNYQSAGDVNVWINTPVVLERMKSIVPDEGDEVLKFIDTSGIGDIEGLGMQLALFDGGLLSEFAILMPAERRGLIEALYTEDTVTLDTARLAPADAYKYTAFTLDLGRIWDATMVILNDSFPETKQQLDMGLGMANGYVGTDIVESFIRRIKGEHTVFQTRDPEGAEKADQMSEEWGFEVPESLEYTVLIATDPSDAFNTSLQQVVDMQIEAGSLPLEKSEFQNVKVYEQPQDPDTPSFGPQPVIGLLDKGLLISASRERLNGVVRQNQSSEESEGLFANEEFAGFMADIESEWLVTVDYTSPELMTFTMDEMISTLALADESFAGMEAPPEEWYETYFGSILGVGYLKPDIYYTNSVWYTID